jgi:SAM-dependent methyltransferase
MSHPHEGDVSITDRIARDWLVTLDLNARFDRPWTDDAVAWLLPGGAGARTVVDAGCGAGGAACAFAHRLGRGSHVVALDRDPRLVAQARRRAHDEGVSDRVHPSVGEVGTLPVRAGGVDLVWASGVVHHVPDQQRAVGELANLLRPGGRVALVEGGLPLRCLPHDDGVGRPGLEARIDAARAGWFDDMRAELRGPPMPYGWPRALASAGLVGIRTRSFLAEATAALDDVGGRIVQQHLTSALGELGERLGADDRRALARLLDPDDVAYVGARDDLVVTAVRTVHVGALPPGD